MTEVRTSCGYVFTTDDSQVEVGDVVPVPVPVVDDPVEMPLAQIKFLGQMFGMQKRWHQPTATKYGAVHGLEHFPEDIFKLSNEDLTKFFIQMYNAGGSLYKHYSGTSVTIPEVRFPCVHESLARELQMLLLRLGIRTRLYNHPQIKKWLVQTSGLAAYVRLRPIIKASRNPKHLKKIPLLDQLVPFEFRDDDSPVQDKVVEVIE